MKKGQEKPETKVWMGFIIALLIICGIAYFSSHFLRERAANPIMDEPIKSPEDVKDDESGEHISVIRARVEDIVREVAAQYRMAPVDAVYNQTYGQVIPEMNGYEIDLEATAQKLLDAKPGEPVIPVWRRLRPAVTMESYPKAYLTCGNPSRRYVTLMINVAWGNEYLPEVLGVLDEYGVKTTFFPVGRWAERFPELLKEIHRRGHELGNHGYSDGEVFSQLRESEAEESLRVTNELIYRFTGQRPYYFTPHKGEFNGGTLEAVARKQMRMLMWTLDTVDWKLPGEEVMAKKVLDNVKPGAIILMHPTAQSAGFLRLALPGLQSRGYKVVPAGVLLSPDPDLPQVTLQR